MFDIENIIPDPRTKQYICSCRCSSPQNAEYLVASYIGISRMFSMSGSMYSQGPVAYIEAGSYDEVTHIAAYINQRI